ncbi:hypothetical protein CHELA40_50188 [Chelatococcus asaccharovorans]|nr:hypothetical protein CHELA40_50188 [Chelatococcus asaccharovorans]
MHPGDEPLALELVQGLADGDAADAVALRERRLRRQRLVRIEFRLGEKLPQVDVDLMIKGLNAGLAGTTPSRHLLVHLRHSYRSPAGQRKQPPCITVGPFALPRVAVMTPEGLKAETYTCAPGLGSVFGRSGAGRERVPEGAGGARPPALPVNAGWTGARE